MRIVCIDNKVIRTDSRGVSYLKTDEFLKVGKSYETFMTPKEFETCSVVGLCDEETEDDIVGDRLYDKYLFLPIAEWREKQLNEIGI